MKELEVTAAAHLLRQELGLEPVAPVPPIVSVVEDFGYRYHEADFDDDFSGYSLVLDDIDAIIGFNRRHHYNEGFRRFTISHELGHLSMDEHRRQIGTTKHTSKPEFQSNDAIEREADRFASHFLAPSAGVKKVTETQDFNRSGVEVLADHFGLSFYAAAIRFVECTDLPCVLIAVDRDGRIVRDSRSRRFHEGHYPEQIRGNVVSAYTVTADVLDGLEGEDAEVPLMEWYPSIDAPELRCTESVVRMSYGNRTLTLLTVLNDGY